jgi:nucleotide-binding universal stress UspA family protein
MTTINRILYATDLSSASEPAWDEAQRLGRLFNAEILLLHVVAPPVVIPVEGYFPPDLYEGVLQDARRAAEKGFDRLLGSVAGSGLKGSTLS